MKNDWKVSYNSPWHAGELELQRSVGVAELMHEIGRRSILDFMIGQHRAFFAKLPFVVAGTVDDNDDVWATLITGDVGFLHASNEYTLSVKAESDPRDPASSGMENGASVGLLGIELHTRRRNRLNGKIRRKNPSGFDVEVSQSFGNCPQFILPRELRYTHDPVSRSDGEVVHMEHLSEQARAMIKASDTFFVASYIDSEKGHQVDVSHRGGDAGFVSVSDGDVLTIPDYAGNSHFSTLGNFLVNPRAGLVFVDFERGDLLQLTGDAQVDLHSPRITSFPGAQRLWHFKPRRIVYRADAFSLRARF